MAEIGRVEWFAIGVTGMALAGAAHAAVGLAHIAREMLRAPVEDAVPGAADLEVVSGPGGWILFGALILTGGAVCHFVSGLGTIIKDVVHVAEH
ncbi:hypothetical protein ACIRBY_03570 [Streptomyces sp. NPDC096136]|uniref:hypothetical protein n=1 Tax=Streptomyces sp. NPDC096136 TaxID=3366076 RepID=UPI00382FE5E7